MDGAPFFGVVDDAIVAVGKGYAYMTGGVDPQRVTAINITLAHIVLFFFPP